MSKLIDVLSHFLAHRKGLVPLLGCLLVLCNFVFRLVAPDAWLANTDLLLHLGVLIAVLGFLIARSL
jgi:hypothetical protein